MSEREIPGYKLSSTTIYANSHILRYATSDPAVYVEFLDPIRINGISDWNTSKFQKYLDFYDTLRGKLLENGIESFIPEIVDYDPEDNWIAYGIPEGFYTFKEIRKSHPSGLDGRTIAWIVRRILMVLTISEVNPWISEDNILINPVDHSILLIGWSIDNHERSLGGLFLFLNDHIDKNDPGAVDQLNFIEMIYRNQEEIDDLHSAGSGNLRELFSYEKILSGYELNLRIIYGDPKYHPLTVDENVSRKFGEIALRDMMKPWDEGGN